MLHSSAKKRDYGEIICQPATRPMKAIQDLYPEDFANCFGCGWNNEDGIHTKTYWNIEKEVGVCCFTPKSYCCGYKGVLHGGIISSIVECNSVATSIAATYTKNGLALGEGKLIFYTLVNINARFSKPIPIYADVVVNTRVTDLKKRMATCLVQVFADGTLSVKASTVTMRVPDNIISSQFVKKSDE